MEELEKKKRAYIDIGGICCLVCGSPDIEGRRGVTINEGSAAQAIKCLECNSEWTDVYTLTEIADTAVPNSALKHLKEA